MADEPAAAPPRRRLSGRATAVVAVCTGLAWLLLDQATKSLAETGLTEGEPVHLVWKLQLNLAYNSGVAFSLGRGSGLGVAPLAIMVTLVVIWVGRTLRGRLAGFVLGVVVGGAFGNLYDRFFRGGAVVDFFDPQFFPIFNVADIGVTCGGIALALLALRDDPAPRRREERAAAAARDAARPEAGR